MNSRVASCAADGKREKKEFLPQSPADLFLRNKKEKLPAKRTAYKYKSFACGERRLQSKKKSRLAAGDAPEQVASLSVFGDYQKLLVIFYALFGAIHGSRAANRDL